MFKYLVQPFRTDVFFAFPKTDQNIDWDLLQDIRHRWRIVLAPVEDIPQPQHNYTLLDRLNLGETGTTVSEQRFLQQLKYIEWSYALKTMHEATHSFQYDVVIKARPDSWCTFEDIQRPIDSIMRQAATAGCLDVFVPNHAHYDGVNDRFAVGNNEVMGVYCNRINAFHSFMCRTEGKQMRQELFLKHHLKANGITAIAVPALISRTLRMNGNFDDLSIVDSPVLTW